LIDLELEVKTYILPDHKDLVTLKNPPGNKPDISIESPKYAKRSLGREQPLELKY
jgi:hypothetical protein